MLIKVLSISSMSQSQNFNNIAFDYILFLKWANPGLFSFIFGLFKQTLQIFTTNRCEKMSIQYMVPGFEPMTFGM